MNSAVGAPSEDTMYCLAERTVIANHFRFELFLPVVFDGRGLPAFIFRLIPKPKAPVGLRSNSSDFRSLINLY